MFMLTTKCFLVIVKYMLKKHFFGNAFLNLKTCAIFFLDLCFGICEEDREVGSPPRE